MRLDKPNSHYGMVLQLLYFRISLNTYFGPYSFDLYEFSPLKEISITLVVQLFNYIQSSTSKTFRIKLILKLFSYIQSKQPIQFLLEPLIEFFDMIIYLFY